MLPNDVCRFRRWLQDNIIPQELDYRLLFFVDGSVVALFRLEGDKGRDWCLDLVKQTHLLFLEEREETFPHLSLLFLLLVFLVILFMFVVLVKFCVLLYFAILLKSFQ